FHVTGVQTCALPIYRTGDITPPALAAEYRMTSPETVGALLAADPPAALLLGFDARLEQPLLAYAEANGYQPVTDLGIRDRYGERSEERRVGKEVSWR